MTTMVTVTLVSTEMSLVLQNSPIFMQKMAFKKQDVRKREGGYNIDTYRQTKTVSSYGHGRVKNHQLSNGGASSIEDRPVLQNSCN